MNLKQSVLLSAMLEMWFTDYLKPESESYMDKADMEG